MRALSATGFRVSQGVVSLLDQTRLPLSESWIECRTLEEVVAAIKALKVRGAPAIGIVAALFMATQAESGSTCKSLLEMSQVLRESRPTAVNLMNYMDRLDEVLCKNEGSDYVKSLTDEVELLFHEDIALCESIASHGLPLLKEGARVLTHCNTGSVATAGRGTALGILTKAHEEGRGIKVWVDETRPLLQGARLTTWELQKAGVPYQLICDNMAGMLMARGEVDAVLVGADRIAQNGDFANKIGTYSLAVLAHHHNVPFYIAAPHTTLDTCATGSEIPIEERRACEVQGFASSEETRCTWSPTDAPVFNPAFDITPAKLVSAWILDTGVRRQKDWQL